MFLRLCSFTLRILNYGQPFVVTIDFDSCDFDGSLTVQRLMRAYVVVKDSHTSRNWRETAVLTSIIGSNVICDLANQDAHKNWTKRYTALMENR
jgi:hypothetical protein